jgi:hypothetical protein
MILWTNGFLVVELATEDSLCNRNKYGKILKIQGADKYEL